MTADLELVDNWTGDVWTEDAWSGDEEEDMKFMKKMMKSWGFAKDLESVFRWMLRRLKAHHEDGPSSAKA